MDVAESPIERLSKKQKRYYSGRTKRHKIKTQIRVCKKSCRVIDTRFAKGARHDFSLYKYTKADLPEEVEYLADSGYQGLLGLHENSRTPFKKPKGGKPADEQKEFNKQLASERLIVEHIIIATLDTGQNAFFDQRDPAMMKMLGMTKRNT